MAKVMGAERQNLSKLNRYYQQYADTLNMSFSPERLQLLKTVQEYEQNQQTIHMLTGFTLEELIQNILKGWKFVPPKPSSKKIYGIGIDKE